MLVIVVIIITMTVAAKDCIMPPMCQIKSNTYLRLTRKIWGCSQGQNCVKFYSDANDSSHHHHHYNYSYLLPILQMRKCELRELEDPDQGHIAKKVVELGLKLCFRFHSGTNSPYCHYCYFQSHTNDTDPYDAHTMCQASITAL